MHENLKTHTSIQNRLPVGIDWIFEGILKSEAGLQSIHTSLAEPIPRLRQSVAVYRSALDEAGIHLHLTDDDVITAGLMRAAIRTGRRSLAFFDVRGLRRAFDAIYELTRMAIPQDGAAVLVVCESRWRELLDSSVRSADRNAAILSPGSIPDTNRFAIRRRKTPADLREIGEYFGLPVLAPASPPEIARYVNEAVRLSKAAGRCLMLLLSPALLGGGETRWEINDPVMRAVPTAALEHDLHRAENPLLLEARKRRIDRVFNAPVPGETAPLGFVTFGSAHVALRHALHILDLTDRLPILKLGLSNPIDPNSATQFLARCRDVVVIENGEPLIEMQLLALAQSMTQEGIQTPRILGKHLNGQPHENPKRHSNAIPRDIELHPSALARIVNELLRTRFLKSPTLQLPSEPLPRHIVDEIRPRKTNRKHLQNISSRGLWRPVLRKAFDDLEDHLARPESGRPALNLRIETAETTSFDLNSDERVIVLIDRRRLVDLGRSIIAHAVRRGLHFTFVVLPAAQPSEVLLGSTEADRMIRGMIADSQASRARIGTLDLTDGTTLRKSLLREILSDSVSVLIVDVETQPRERRNAELNHLDLSERGIPEIEYHVQPASDETTLHLEWLIKRGWNDIQQLDSAHAPAIEPPKPDNPIASPLDAWDGFEEWRIFRKISRQPAGEPSPPLPDPKIRNADEPYWRAHIAGPSASEVRRITSLICEIGMRMNFRIQTITGRDRAGAFSQIAFSRPRPDKPADQISARIPTGAAQLLIAMHPDSLLEAVASANHHFLASPESVGIILDTGCEFDYTDAEKNDDEFLNWKQDEKSAVSSDELALVENLRRNGFSINTADMQKVCERSFYRRDLSAAAVVGLAFQLGLIPATTAAIEKIGQGERIDEPTSRTTDSPDLIRRAVTLGRKHAVCITNAETSTRQTESEPPAKLIPASFPNPLSAKLAMVKDRQGPEHLVRKHAFIMSRRLHPLARRRATQFRLLAFGSLDAMTGLRRGDPTRRTEREFVNHLIDCETWGGIDYANSYAQRIRALYHAESESEDFELTTIVITELARAMIWIDPVFLCELALRADRIRSMSRTLSVNRQAGDRFTYRIRTRAQMNWVRTLIGPYWKFTPLTAGLVRHARPLRIIPRILRNEKRYRNWVRDLIDQCVEQLPEGRSLWLEALRQLERVHGPAPARWQRLASVQFAVQSILDLGRPHLDPQHEDSSPPTAK